jgi:hypothetical protein
MGRTWGRLYANTRNHHKIRALRRKHPRYWKAIYPLMEMSFEADDQGNIYISPGEPYSMQELAKEVDEPLAKLTKLLQDMVKFGLISLQENVPKFLSYNERQFTTDSSGAERTKRWRDKAKQSVTLQKRHRDVECDAPEQNRTEQNRNTPLPPKGGNGIDQDFEVWWKAYPSGRRKQGKPVCLAKWKHLRKTGTMPPLPEMIKTLEAQKQSIDWVKNGGEFIPGPLPYLNQAKFIDESVNQSQADQMDNYLNFLAERDGVSNES